jgi:hypothetical protein
MVLKIIIVIIFSIVAAFVINTIEEVKRSNACKISFREAMDLVELPVITFYNNGKKFNFLLDTGSTHSHINKAVLDCFKYETTQEMLEVMGMEGNKVTNEICQITLSYKDKEFENLFSITDLEEAFNALKAESGVQVHGILGCGFFEKYKYVLDFKEMIAYSKK